MRLCAALAFTSVAAAAPEQQQPAPEALAPGLQVAGDARPPPSVGATIAASGGYDDAAGSPRRLFVHCERGSDERDGRSLATALPSPAFSTVAPALCHPRQTPIAATTAA